MGKEDSPEGRSVQRDKSISTSSVKSIRSVSSNRRLNGNLVSNKILSNKKPLLSGARNMKRKKGTVKPPSIRETESSRNASSIIIASSRPPSAKRSNDLRSEVPMSRKQRPGSYHPSNGSAMLSHHTDRNNMA